ncbi:MAG: glycosyltransferase [Gammaproteobacteria bacterium]|nr:glycosyltransferase [Gammaproteobacteria bacterium]
MSDITADKPLISIVLPTYNRAYVLPHAIRSVLSQTYSNLELIVVDDNSSDNTRAIVESFSDPRIHYVRNEPNLKLPRALNRGFSLARGDYLTWTSDDNMYAPTAIEKMVNALQNTDCEFVYADYYLFADADTTGKPLDMRHERLPSQLHLERTNHIGACFLYTRKAYQEIGEYDPELFLVEDYDYFIRIAKQFKCCHIPEPLYYFRRDDNTLFCSRFCEVKAADVLVRYKNDLLNEKQALDAVVSLFLRDLDGLKNPLLRWSRLAVRKVSFRLTNIHNQICSKYLHWRLGENVASILGSYRAKAKTFAEAKTALSSLMQRVGRIEYLPPKLGNSSSAGKE